MQLSDTAKRRRINTLLLGAGIVVILYIFRRAVIRIFSLILSASVLLFLVLPIANLFEKKLSRPLSALLSLMATGAVLIGIIWLILPIMIHETALLIRLLPDSIAAARQAVDRIAAWFAAHFAGISLKDSLFSGMSGNVSSLATDAFAFAGSVAGIIGKASLSVVLCFFMLCDRERLLLRLEMLFPQKHRPLVAKMGCAVIRELRMYLRGQFSVSVIVAALSTSGLLLLRVRSALALGPLIGLMNMIPYFGPFIGGAPAVLVALADSWQKAVLAIIMLVLVQQLDNILISPRVMGNLTGLSPAIVLISIFAGSQIAGIVGMLFALPLIMTYRTLFRVFVQRHENI